MTRLTYRVHGTQRKTDWRENGACRQYDPDTFFSKSTHAIAQAKRICGACPVRQQCMQLALDNGEAFGVWGGLSQRELRALRSQRRQPTQDAA